MHPVPRVPRVEQEGHLAVLHQVDLEDLVPVEAVLARPHHRPGLVYAVHLDHAVQVAEVVPAAGPQPPTRQQVHPQKAAVAPRGRSQAHRGDWGTGTVLAGRTEQTILEKILDFGIVSYYRVGSMQLKN